ncbi:Motility protein A [Planctomycetaceae bacterium]|nr:Motility protein A [Planctomycetaceae bacterium]
MFVIIGAVVVLVGVVGGFMIEGGPVAVLIQPVELMIIMGAAVGSLLVMSPLAVLKGIIGNVLKVLKGDPYSKERYVDLLKTLFELFTVAKRDGLIALEPHVMDPEKSAVFSKNEFLLHQHHALFFLCDTMKLLLGGGVPPYDVEALLDADIESHHAEGASAPALIQKIGDALPGLGIVAAVLGIIITMGAISGPPEEVGHHVAVALVGTFIGILLSYGFVQPVATHIELLQASEARYFECMKAGIVAYAKGNAPIIVVEFARRVIYHSVRPSFAEVEAAVRSAKPQQ